MLCEAKLPFLFSYLFSGNEIFSEKSEERKEKGTKRNDNFLTKIVVSFWSG